MLARQLLQRWRRPLGQRPRSGRRVAVRTQLPVPIPPEPPPPPPRLVLSRPARPDAVTDIDPSRRLVLL